MTEVTQDQYFTTMVSNLLKKGDDILASVTGPQLNMLHNAVGISGEAGELLDAVKKQVIYQKEADIVNIVEELGDLEFYMEGLRQAYGITRDETIAANIAKLSIRYSKGSYSDTQAQTRADKEV